MTIILVAFYFLAIEGRFGFSRTKHAGLRCFGKTENWAKIPHEKLDLDSK